MDLKITGLDQVQRALAELPKLAAGQALERALDRGIGVIAADVEARTPEGPEGLLKESVKTVVAIDVGRGGGVAAVGFTSDLSERNGVPQDAVALWVEFGHRIVSHGTSNAEKQYGGENVKPHPFMRPAFESSVDHAIEVFAATLIEGLSQAGVQK